MAPRFPVWPFGPGSPALDAAAVTVAARSSGPDGDADLPPDRVAASVSLLLAEGLTARVAYLMGAEKAALRCAAREVTSARSLALARSGSLDRHGADLSVARFTDRLVGTAGPPPQISTAPRLEPDGREPDQDYRRRLAAMRSWAVPTAAGLAEAVNGPGSAGDPRAGWLADLGGTVRIEIIEQTNPLAIGVLLVPAEPGRGTTLSPRCGGTGWFARSRPRRRTPTWLPGCSPPISARTSPRCGRSWRPGTPSRARRRAIRR